MVTPIRISPEQQAIVEEVQAFAARFTDQNKLYQSTSAINQAKALITKAVDAGLDERFYHNLQLWVSMYDIEQNGPAHLRSFQPKP